MKLEQIKKLNIPESPGCYEFFDGAGEIIYAGKAVNLKSRVLSYWQKGSGLTPAKERMVGEIARVKWITVESEVEAFLLEANLIKKYQPKYNILFRDDKRFSYIKVSVEEEWPRIYSTRTIDKSGKYFGPFISGLAVRETLKIIRRIWPYRTCYNLPKRACLYYYVGKCAGMCEKKISHKEYLEYVKQVIRFLEGRKKDVVNDIKKRIKNYELRIKNLPANGEERELLEKNIDLLNYRLLNIEKVIEMSRVISIGEKYQNDVLELAKIMSLPVVPERIEGYDISNIFGREAVGSMVVFSGGEPDRSQYRKFKIKADKIIFTGLKARGGDIKMLEEVLARRFKHFLSRKNPLPDLPLSPPAGESEGRGREKDNWPLPDLVIIDGGKAQLNVALRALKKYKLDIPVIAISKGEGLRSALAPDKLFFAGEKTPLELPLASPALHLIKRVRDEAHRFAIGYHRLLRKKRFLGKA
ncbi:MAG: excinuclease ABC subunit UvrC [Patescibacteria group bacterium]|jgi:excinuclease ABC subunit C